MSHGRGCKVAPDRHCGPGYAGLRAEIDLSEGKHRAYARRQGYDGASCARCWMSAREPGHPEPQQSQATVPLLKAPLQTTWRFAGLRPAEGLASIATAIRLTETNGSLWSSIFSSSLRVREMVVRLAIRYCGDWEFQGSWPAEMPRSLTLFQRGARSARGLITNYGGDVERRRPPASRRPDLVKTSRFTMRVPSATRSPSANRRSIRPRHGLRGVGRRPRPFRGGRRALLPGGGPDELDADLGPLAPAHLAASLGLPPLPEDANKNSSTSRPFSPPSSCSFAPSLETSTITQSRFQVPSIAVMVAVFGRPNWTRCPVAVRLFTTIPCPPRNTETERFPKHWPRTG